MKNAMKKAKSWLQSKTAKVSLAASGAMMGLMASASAAEGDTVSGSATVISALETGFGSIAGDLLTTIGKIVVIALPVAGVIVVARKAIGWFKSLLG